MNIKFALSALILFSPGPGNVTPTRAFATYYNCADQGIGPPLTTCTTMRIYFDGSKLYIKDYFHEGMNKVSSAHYLAIDDDVLPIAVPREYEKFDSWTFKNRRYFKARKDLINPFAGEKVDVIAVISNIDKIPGGKDIYSINDPRAIASFSFWYTKKRGVVAVGFHQESDSGEVYTCLEETCLFGDPDAP